MQGAVCGAFAWDTCPRIVLGFSGAGSRAARGSSVRCTPGAVSGRWPSDSWVLGQVADPVSSGSEAGHGTLARVGELAVLALGIGQHPWHHEFHSQGHRSLCRRKFQSPLLPVPAGVRALDELSRFLGPFLVPHVALLRSAEVAPAGPAS